jgi:O-antigen/teichoic acid export membrane protein
MSLKPSNSRDPYFQTDHLIAGIGGHTARGGVVTILAHGLKFLVSIIATAVLARLLTPGDYGLIGMVAVATNFVAIFKDLGLSFATVQKAEINSDQITTLFWINVLLSAGITILMVAFAPAVAWFYGEPRLTGITIVTSFGFVLGGLAVQHEALLKRQMRFFALSAIAFASMTAGYIVGIVLAWYGIRYWALVFSQLALLATNLLGVWIWCGWRPGWPRINSGIRSMLTFGGNITGYALVNYISNNSDYILIGRFWGSKALGFYNKAAQVLGLPTDQINEPLASVAIPALSRLTHSSERYLQAYLRIMQKVLLLTMPAITLMIAAADWLILIVLGPQWSETAHIFMWMGIAGLFQPLISTAGWLFVSQGRARHMLNWSIINWPISILAIIAGLPWGPVGVAASYSVTKFLILNPLLYWYVGREGPVRTRDFYRLMAPFTLASASSLFTCFILRRLVPISTPVVGLFACAAVVAFTTLLVLLLVPSGRSALLDVMHSLRLLKLESVPRVNPECQ